MKITIPYYLHKAGAGFPSPATDYIEEDIDLNVHLIRNVPATFVIRVQGKSMTDVGINDGDILVVDKSLKPKNFSTVIANVHDELVVKSFVQERDKKFLTSGSKNFKDRILINEEEDIDLNMHLIRNVPATFIIRVQGKSMVDVGINDGDLLVVDKSLKPKNFSTVIANVHDELVVKTLVQERDKKFLTSGSKEFSDRILINEEQDIFIWGVVTYVIHSTY